VYQGAPDAFNKVSLLLIKKNIYIFFKNKNKIKTMLFHYPC
jgi:hypothetical protein